jgi:hypothetical protein
MLLLANAMAFSWPFCTCDNTAPMQLLLASVSRMNVGFCSYYQRFIEGFADIAKPLHKLTQKDKLFVWTDECQVSFDQLKNC